MLTLQQNTRIDDAVCQVRLSGREVSLGRLQMMLSDISICAIEKRMAAWGIHNFAQEVDQHEEARQLLSGLLKSRQNKAEGNTILAYLTAATQLLRARIEGEAPPFENFEEHVESLAEASNAESIKEILKEYLPRIEAIIPNFLQLCADDPEALARLVCEVRPAHRRLAFRP